MYLVHVSYPQLTATNNDCSLTKQSAPHIPLGDLQNFSVIMIDLFNFFPNRTEYCGVTKHMWSKVSSPGFFNLTSHFRMDSDLPRQYLGFTKMPSEFRINQTKIIESKKKLLLWIVSNCKTHGNREGFVEVRCPQNFMSTVCKPLKYGLFPHCNIFIFAISKDVDQFFARI